MAGLCLCLLGAFLLGKMGKRRTMGFMGAFLFLGLLLCGKAMHPALPTEGKFSVTGIVAEEVTLRQDGSAQGYLEQTQALTENGTQSLGTVYWTFVPDEETSYLPTDGQRVSFTGKVYLPSGRENPYGFDFRMFLLQKGICCGVSGAKDLAILSQETRGLSSFFYRSRLFLGNRLDAVFGEESALPRALLLGERERLPEDVQFSFADAGVAHILSVSGLHVSLLAFLAMRLVPQRLGHRFRFWFLLVFLLFYLGIINYPAPAVRAGVFMLISRYRPVARRSRDWPTVVAAAFLLILLCSPLTLFSASFQLSFGAVLGIFVFLPKLQKCFPRQARKKLGTNILLTLSAALGLALPSVQIFHRFSLIGLIINPFVCLLFLTLLPLYALLMLLGCVWLPAAQTLAIPFQITTSAVTDLLTWAGKLPFASLPVPYLPWYCVGAISLLFILCTGLVAMKKKKRQLVSLAALVIAFSIWPFTVCRDVQYIQFSTGQSDAAAVLDGRETVVIDAGEYGGDVANYLQCTGRRADTLICTHLHRDHFLGIRQFLEKRVSIGRIILPTDAFEVLADEECLQLLAQLEEMKIPVHFMHAGQYFETGRCRFTALWPVEDTAVSGADANRYPLALYCDLDGVTFLTASDMDGAYEHYIAQDADILKVAHHGSNHSTSDVFLQSVTPAAALICATDHSETLPSPDLLSRLAKHGVSVYNTGEWGAVTVTCRSGQATLHTYLPQDRSVP